MSNDLLTANDTLLMLDEMLGHEAGCESTHSSGDNLVCSVEVTHRMATACGRSFLFCKNAATTLAASIPASKLPCACCFRMVPDCWTVTPA